MFQYVCNRFYFSKVTYFKNYFSNNNRNLTDSIYQRGIPTPYNTQLESALLSSLNRLKAAVTVKIKPLSDTAAKSKDPTVSSLLKKPCFIYGINAVPKLKTNTANAE